MTTSVRDLVAAVAQVRRGRLFIRHRHAFDQAVAQLDERWQLEVTVKRLRSVRSQVQNAYYWSVVVGLLSSHTGYTPEEIHDVLKAKFIPKHMALTDGNGEIKGELVIGGSTREMNTVQFGDYLDRIKVWAAQDLDVYIPDPGESV